jgi:hypothetical protein
MSPKVSRTALPSSVHTKRQSLYRTAPLHSVRYLHCPILQRYADNSSVCGRRDSYQGSRRAPSVQSRIGDKQAGGRPQGMASFTSQQNYAEPYQGLQSNTNGASIETT